jgi:hypothetical protein
MNTNFRIGNTLLVTLLACGLVACTSQGSNTEGTGGSGAAGVGGTTTSTGGAGPVAGTTGSGNGEGTLCAAPPALITDFTYNTSAAGTTTNQPNLSSSTTFSGAGLYDNASPSQLTSDVTQGNWHISGTVSNYAGFNFFLRNCDRIDASMYKGISFTISGSAPQGITFDVGIVSDTPSGTWLLANGAAPATTTTTEAGRCTPTSNTQNQYYHPGCGDPTTPITVTASPVVQNVLWANLAGGTPVASPAASDTSEITAISWIIPWSSGSYAVDITLDDLKFIQ